jgi:polyisoprenoid-binding protein YceI
MKTSFQYEYISFTPTAVDGLPSSFVVGQPATFHLTGDLKIKDVTRPATFEVTVTPRPRRPSSTPIGA